MNNIGEAFLRDLDEKRSEIEDRWELSFGCSNLRRKITVMIDSFIHGQRQAA